MNQEQLAALLATLTGHLRTTQVDEEQLNALQQAAADALLQQAPDSVSNRPLSFEATDLFSAGKIQAERQSAITELAKTFAEKEPEEKEENLRMFVRDVPVRTTQIPGSVPSWAAGAELAQSFGPFLAPDGRLTWFDFYRTDKLIALYLDGQALPVLLFKASLRRGLLDIITSKNIAAQKHYNVVEGSVWIKASLLSPSAPADRYCGLRVKDGDITLDAAPDLVTNKLVIKNNNRVRVAVNLVQQNDPASGVTDAAGTDARNAVYTLPGAFAFSFIGTAKTLEQIGAARWDVYGNTLQFAYNGNQSVLYNTPLSRVLVPMQTEPANFEVSNCLSPFLSLSGSAAIQQAYWALPAATLDIANPLAAEGSGALLVHCKKGLRCSWQTLNGNEAALPAPFLFGEPGRIAITDLAMSATGTTQRTNLWKDD
ncbi:MAG TPA: hypothetical protein VFT06_01010, partial [Flavisolibacter sp.]|nr:hypothetical protein [Flavisolibacter sp.]